VAFFTGRGRRVAFGMFITPGEISFGVVAVWIAGKPEGVERFPAVKICGVVIFGEKRAISACLGLASPASKYFNGAGQNEQQDNYGDSRDGKILPICDYFLCKLRHSSNYGLRRFF